MTPESTRKLIRDSRNRRETFLGSCTSTFGVEENIGITDRQHLIHVLNTGPTGFGKSQLMCHTALQTAEKGHGLCIINPKGGLIDEFLAKLPERRREDVCYINPGREPVTPINVLEPQTTGGMTDPQRETQKEIIVSDLIDLFKRRSESWGDRFGRVLETLFRAYLDQNIRHGGSNTLVDVFRCVIQTEELTQLIDTTRDPIVREQLVQIKENLSSYELEPLQRRLNDFVMRPTIRKIIGPESSGLDFQHAVNTGKIVLVDIQKGEVGDTVSELVGSIVLTQIWAAAQSRITQPVEERRPFYLYVDELQNFAGEGSNFTKILSEAREYRLGCWLATQYLQQLGPEMRRAVTNNCRTKICFNPAGSDDLSRMARMFDGVSKERLSELGKYRAAIQKPSERDRARALTFETYPPWKADYSEVDMLKQRCTPGSSQPVEVGIQHSLGKQAIAGGERHRKLLEQAKSRLEELGFDVYVLYQDHGSEKPDGYVSLPDGETAHLEAESATLTKPAKVLQNLRRGLEQGREVIFVVEQGKAKKLENIVSDPVNRRNGDREDGDGGFSYYKDTDSNPVTDIKELQQAEYRILEIEDDLGESGSSEEECPELEYSDQNELETFCLYREEDGFCSQLEKECVLEYE